MGKDTAAIDDQNASTDDNPSFYVDESLNDQRGATDNKKEKKPYDLDAETCCAII